MLAAECHSTIYLIRLANMERLLYRNTRVISRENMFFYQLISRICCLRIRSHIVFIKSVAFLISVLITAALVRQLALENLSAQT